MRHGESEANVAGLIVSNPEQGCHAFGLTENGKQQVLSSIKGSSEIEFDVIITSDFLRARQTAEIVAEWRHLPAPGIKSGLRERWFGKWDDQSDTHYQDIWKNDIKPDSANDKNVEPVEKVLQRGLDVIEQLEKEYSDKSILLVSHGDMLQILRTAFNGVAPSQHRQLPHHRTAQIIKF
jgi:broad specificity phosphatase PhoE